MVWIFRAHSLAPGGMKVRCLCPLGCGPVGHRVGSEGCSWHMGDPPYKPLDEQVPGLSLSCPLPLGI